MTVTLLFTTGSMGKFTQIPPFIVWDPHNGARAICDQEVAFVNWNMKVATIMSSTYKLKKTQNRLLLLLKYHHLLYGTNMTISQKHFLYYVADQLISVNTEKCFFSCFNVDPKKSFCIREAESDSETVIIGKNRPICCLH